MLPLIFYFPHSHPLTVNVIEEQAWWTTEEAESRSNTETERRGNHGTETQGAARKRPLSETSDLTHGHADEQGQQRPGVRVRRQRGLRRGDRAGCSTQIRQSVLSSTIPTSDGADSKWT